MKLDWRRINLILVGVIALVAVIRLLTGNLLGGLFAGAIAFGLATLTLDVSIKSRLRKLWRLAIPSFGRKDDDDEK